MKTYFISCDLVLTLSESLQKLVVGSGSKMLSKPTTSKCGKIYEALLYLVFQIVRDQNIFKDVRIRICLTLQVGN